MRASLPRPIPRTTRGDPPARRLAAALILALAALAATLAPDVSAAQSPRSAIAWAPPGWSPSGMQQGAATTDPVVVAARTIPSGAVLGPSDLVMASTAWGAGLPSIDRAVGQETRVALYAGRPVRPEDIGPPTLVERNGLVLLRYHRGALLITAEGRALDRGSAGDWIRATNLVSRQTVTGRVSADGIIEVAP